MRLSFLLVALWWAVFTLPLLRYVREPRGERRACRAGRARGLAQLGAHLAPHPRSCARCGCSCIAYWLYIDGVDTVIRMAVDYGLSLGLDSSEL